MSITVDPRRKEKINRYKAPKLQGQGGGANEDMMPDYMNILGMIFSMCGLMMKVLSNGHLFGLSLTEIYFHSSSGVPGLRCTALASVLPAPGPVTMRNKYCPPSCSV